jgi:hypothetical protein
MGINNLRQTHTYAVLEISKAAYKEIRDKLAKAGYDHAFNSDSEHKEVIDMHGIALAVTPRKRTG